MGAILQLKIASGFAISTTSALFLAACAPSPDRVQPLHASTALYENLTCQQLVAEARNVSAEAHRAAGQEARHHTEDVAVVTAGVLVFWPAIFFAHGHDATTAELATLRGQMEAIETASEANDCGIVFERA